MGQQLTHLPSGRTSPLTVRALEVAEAGQDLVEFLAPVPYPSGPVIVDGKGGTDWIIADARLDPHVAAGTLSIPRHARRRLERIRATGVGFDALLIGHELAPGTVANLSKSERAALSASNEGLASKTASATLTEGLARVVGAPLPDRTASKTVALTERTLGALRKGAIAVGTGAAAVGAGAASLLDGFDPVVFGVAATSREPQPGELVALFYLAHWT